MEKHIFHSGQSSSRSSQRVSRSSRSISQEDISNRYQGDRSRKEIIKDIYTEEVARTLKNYPANRVLHTRPPDINAEELDLPRHIRTKLARLRSGFCCSLKSYMSRIDNSVTDSCPKCNQTPHDTEHLFKCPANPTDLEVSDL